MAGGANQIIECPDGSVQVIEDSGTEVVIAPSPTIIVEEPTAPNVVLAPETPTNVLEEAGPTIIVSNTGPQGPAAEDELVFAKRVDFAVVGPPEIIYRAEAAVGTLNAAATWRVRRLTLASDDDVTEEWASGNANFDKVWNDRLGFVYT